MIDSREESVGPFTVRFTLHHDNGMGDPVQEYGEDGGYGPTDSPVHRAWKDDRWRWVTMGCAVLLDGYEVASTSIGGLEYGDYPLCDLSCLSGGIVRWEWLDPLAEGDSTGYLADLRSEALVGARKELERMAQSCRDALAQLEGVQS